VRSRDAEPEAADVQFGAEQVEQAAVEGVEADLGTQLGLADQCGLVSEVAGPGTRFSSR
jgi:hypothetical protein